MNRLTTSGPIRVHREANGNAHVVADIPTQSFRGAFHVMRSGATRVRVGLGTVADIIPRIGKEPLNAAQLPQLDLDGGPNKELLSWVCVRVTVDPATGIIDPEKHELVQIVHVNDYSLLGVNGLAPDDGQGNGYHPLALVVWSSKTRLRGLVQNTWFNQRHSFQKAAQGARGIHYFMPVL